MRALERNKQQFWYCLFDSASEIEDEYGNATGELDVRYLEAVEMYANISPATGQAQTEIFGGLDNYDKVIVTDDLNCPIDEQTVLFIDKEPEYDEETEEVPVESGTLYGEQTESVVIKRPKYDYIVKRVAVSLNSISIAVRKVNVGEHQD